MNWQGTFKRGSHFAAIFLVTALVSSCGKQLSGFNVRESIGLTKTTPDEFVVVSSQPLSVPPEFRLPEPGAETSVSRKRNDLSVDGLGVLRSAGGAKTTGKNEPKRDASLFLKKIGANDQDAQARETLNKEDELSRQQKAEEGKKWFSPISELFSSDKKDVKLVEPDLERERISKIKKEGKIVTGEGSAATETGGKTGLLGKILGQ